MVEVLKSKIDSSVNFIEKTVDGGKIECRFVQRTPEYFIVYVSSHTGCNQSCRFCHLTQLRQTTFSQVTVNEYLSQLVTVLDHYESTITYNDPRAEKVHINFMARGEPLLNKNLKDGLFKLMDFQCVARRYKPVFKISTIFPRGANINFSYPGTEIYYSLYSLDPAFRKKWLPKAEDPDVALKKLKEWKDRTGHRVKLHWALIQGENDSLDSINEILLRLDQVGLSDVGFNLVRYNPYDSTKSQEPPEEKIQEYVEAMKKGLSEVKVIPRVGRDVAASCGTFIA